MNNKTLALILFILIIAAAGVGWWMWRDSQTGNGSPTPSPTVTATETPTNTETPTPTEVGSTGTPSTTTTAQESTVVIKNMAFDTANLTVHVGDTVIWRNDDSIPHTVTANDGNFDSSTISAGKTFSFTFTTAGTFQYHCAIHPSMTGTVTVQ